MVQMMSDDEPAREEMENELLRSTAVLRSLPDGVVICDRAGIVRFINPPGARLLRVDVDQWLNHPLVDLPHGAALSECAIGELSKNSKYLAAAGYVASIVASA